MKKVAVVAALAAALALVLASCANSSGGDDAKKKGNVLSGTTWVVTMQSGADTVTSTLAFTSDTEVSVTQLFSSTGKQNVDTGTYVIAGTTVVMTLKTEGELTATLNDAANPTSLECDGVTLTKKP